MAANHSVTYFIKDLLDYKNENFETHIFSDVDVKKEDDTTKIIKAKVDFFHNISSKNNSEFASFLRSIDIDVLIDMNGYVGKGRVEIFNSRVCKIQISWLGYNNTIGLNHSDYLIADKNLILKRKRSLSRKNYLS